DTWIDGGRTSFPYTPSGSDVNGGRAACDEALELGIDGLVDLHTRAARASRAGARAMGLDLWARSDDICTNCVTAVRTPDGIDTLALLAHVRERYGVMLSPGYGEIKEKLVRLGHMGPAARSLHPLGAPAPWGLRPPRSTPWSRSPRSVAASPISAPARRSAPASRPRSTCSRRP